MEGFREPRYAGRYAVPERSGHLPSPCRPGSGLMLDVARDSNPVATFRSAAERYVAVIEGAEGQSVERLFADLVEVLPVLYERAARLPHPGVSGELPDTARLTHEQWTEVCDRLERVFG